MTPRAPARPGARGLMRAWALVLAHVLALGGAPGVQAQPLLLTAGEHRDFTRVVVQSTRSFDWTLTEDGADLRLRLVGRPVRLDPDELFARIPRDRLAAARLEGDVLVLTRACACPVTAVPDRPGVLVLDLSDPVPTPPAPPAPGPPAPAVPAAPSAQEAGLALARRLAMTGPETATGADPIAALGPPEGFRAALAAQVAQAVSQGLIAGPPSAARPQTLPEAAALTDLPAPPPNLRLRDATDPVPAPRAETAAADCPDPATLAFLTTHSEAPFAVTLAALRNRLYGEFDAADARVRLDLARHYIAWGLGIEARHLLDSAGAAGDEAILLAALADTLEGVSSNRRQGLAGLADCPGPVAAFAALAGAPDPAVMQAGARIAGDVQAMPPALRWAIGPDLAARLLTAGAVEPARMVLDALRRAPAPGVEPPAVLARLEAELELARGAPERAAARLDGADDADLVSHGLTLQIGLERGIPAEVAVLEDLVILAEPLRRTEPARAAVELAIRHHRLAGRIGVALALTDRLESWLDPTPSSRARIAVLRDEVWSAAADLPDAGFLDIVLARGDWRSADLPAATRARIADRLRALGLRVEGVGADGAVLPGARPPEGAAAPTDPVGGPTAGSPSPASPVAAADPAVPLTSQIAAQPTADLGQTVADGLPRSGTGGLDTAPSIPSLRGLAAQGSAAVPPTADAGAPPAAAPAPVGPSATAATGGEGRAAAPPVAAVAPPALPPSAARPAEGPDQAGTAADAAPAPPAFDLGAEVAIRLGIPGADSAGPTPEAAGSATPAPSLVADPTPVPGGDAVGGRDVLADSARTLADSQELRARLRALSLGQ